MHRDLPGIRELSVLPGLSERVFNPLNCLCESNEKTSRAIAIVMVDIHGGELSAVQPLAYIHRVLRGVWKSYWQAEPTPWRQTNMETPRS